MIKKKKKSKAKQLKESQKEESLRSAYDINHSAIYKKNEKTGEWQVKNPAGSMAYNYLYRDDDSE